MGSLVVKVNTLITHVGTKTQKLSSEKIHIENIFRLLSAARKREEKQRQEGEEGKTLLKIR